MKEKVNQVFQNIQQLEIQPTEHNVMLIADSLLKLKDLYAQLTEMQSAVAEKEEPADAADSE